MRAAPGFPYFRAPVFLRFLMARTADPSPAKAGFGMTGQWGFGGAGRTSSTFDGSTTARSSRASVSDEGSAVGAPVDAETRGLSPLFLENEIERKVAFFVMGTVVCVPRRCKLLNRRMCDGSKNGI